MKLPNAPGSAQFEFTMSKVKLEGEGIGRITGAIALAFNQVSRLAFKSSGDTFEGFESISGAITKSTVTIEHGKVSHRLNLETDRFGAWTFDGNLNLANKTFNYLNVQVPTSMFGRNNDLARFLGERISFPFSGPINRPALAPNFVNKLVEQNLKSAVPNLLEGVLKPKNDRDRDRDREQPRGDDPIPNRPPNNATERDRRSQPDDLLGGLIDQFGGGLLGQDEEARDAKTAGQRRSGTGSREDMGDQRISGNPDQPPPARRSTARPPAGNNAVSGDDRISANPANPANPGRTSGNERVSGNERISGDPNAPPNRPTTTQPTTRRARSGRR
jgi:hypothetical protein